MRQECQERFPRHRFQRKPLVSDPGIHHGTYVTHVTWYMSGSLTRGGGENVPGIPGACATCNFTCLARGLWLHECPVLCPRSTRLCLGDSIASLIVRWQMTTLIQRSLTRHTRTLTGCDGSFQKPLFLIPKYIICHKQLPQWLDADALNEMFTKYKYFHIKFPKLTRDGTKHPN